VSQSIASRSFLIRELLGTGGFGEVYRALMSSTAGLQTEVAIKILHDPRPQAVRRMRDEGRLLASLRHPAILRVLDLTAVDGRVALVTEYVAGRDLAAFVGGDQAIPVRAGLEVIAAVADALDAAWTGLDPDKGRPLRLVHRDIKPSNIRIGTHGEVKLLDFGIAYTEGFTREAKTQTNSLIGSLAYMSPERFAMASPTHASDAYSLGCVLFEVLAGQPLCEFASPAQAAMLASASDRHHAYLEERLELLPDELSEELVALVVRTLSFEPAERPTAAELHQACEHMADELGGLSVRRWARALPWDDERAPRGPLTGRSLDESATPAIPTRPTLAPVSDEQRALAEVPTGGDAAAGDGGTFELDGLDGVGAGAAAGAADGASTAGGTFELDDFGGPPDPTEGAAAVAGGTFELDGAALAGAPEGEAVSPLAPPPRGGEHTLDHAQSPSAPAPNPAWYSRSALSMNGAAWPWGASSNSRDRGPIMGTARRGWPRRCAPRPPCGPRWGRGA